MGGKKKGGKGGGKKGGGDGTGMTQEEQNQVYETMRDALATRLVQENEKANQAKKVENEMRLRELALERRAA